MAALERKKERIESAGSMGKGTTQMSDALKGLASAQERPTGPSQHQQALERLNRGPEQKSGDVGAYSGRPKPQIVNSTLEADMGGNQMQQAKAALFQKNQQEERRGSGSMKEEAMRKPPLAEMLSKAGLLRGSAFGAFGGGGGGGVRPNAAAGNPNAGGGMGGHGPGAHMQGGMGNNAALGVAYQANHGGGAMQQRAQQAGGTQPGPQPHVAQIGRASCRERV